MVHTNAISLKVRNIHNLEPLLLTVTTRVISLIKFSFLKGRMRCIINCHNKCYEITLPNSNSWLFKCIRKKCDGKCGFHKQTNKNHGCHTSQVMILFLGGKYMIHNLQLGEKHIDNTKYEHCRQGQIYIWASMGCSPGAPKPFLYIYGKANICNEGPPNSISPEASKGLNLALIVDYNMPALTPVQCICLWGITWLLADL